MGIDTVISLPANVRVRDVASVLGRLLGCKAKQVRLNAGTSYTEVSGVTVNQSAAGLESCADIECVNVSATRRFLYHFEGPGGRRSIILHGQSNRNMWLAQRLVDFFGGKVDFNDSDRIEVDYEVADKSDAHNHAEDGQDWADLQHRILHLQPLVTLNNAAL